MDRKTTDRAVEESMEPNVELTKLTDAELVALARNGRDDAFGELVRRHRQRCIEVASYILKNRGDAEDEAQNAIFKAYTHLDQFQNEAEFATWLARIVTNQCLMVLRARRRSRAIYLDEPTTDQHVRRLELPAEGPDPEGEVAARQVMNLLQVEMRRIPPLLRRVMELRDLEQLPMLAVADRLGITVPAAKSRLLRARLELRSRILKHHKWINSTSNPLSDVAAPLERVGRHYALAAV